MANAIGSATRANAPASVPIQPIDGKQKDAVAPPRPPVVGKSIVILSKAGQAAAKEFRETPAQTAQEANAGDQQAQRLLAKQAAAKAYKA